MLCKGPSRHWTSWAQHEGLGLGLDHHRHSNSSGAGPCDYRGPCDGGQRGNACNCGRPRAVACWRGWCCVLFPLGGLLDEPAGAQPAGEAASVPADDPSEDLQDATLTIIPVGPILYRVDPQAAAAHFRRVYTWHMVPKFRPSCRIVDQQMFNICTHM